MKIDSRYFIYFLLAAFPYALGAPSMPATGWDWFKLVGTAIYQGLLAIKAYQSQPQSESPPVVVAPVVAAPNPLLANPPVAGPQPIHP